MGGWRLVLRLAVLVLPFGAAYAYPPAVVQGHVLDAVDGRPVQTVVYAFGGGSYNTTSSPETGYYRIENVNPGTYWLYAMVPSAPPYHHTTPSYYYFAISYGQSATCDFQMHRPELTTGLQILDPEPDEVVGNSFDIRVRVRWRPRVTGPAWPPETDPVHLTEVHVDELGPPAEQYPPAQHLDLTPRNWDPATKQYYPDGSVSVDWLVPWDTAGCFNEPYHITAECEFTNPWGDPIAGLAAQVCQVENVYLDEVEVREAGSAAGSGRPDCAVYDPADPDHDAPELTFTIVDEGVQYDYHWYVYAGEDGGSPVIDGEAEPGEVIVDLTEPPLGEWPTGVSPFEVKVVEWRYGYPQDSYVYRSPYRLGMTIEDALPTYRFERREGQTYAIVEYGLSNTPSAGSSYDPDPTRVLLDLLAPGLDYMGPSLNGPTSQDAWIEVEEAIDDLTVGGQYRVVLRAEDGNGVLPEPVYREHRNRWMTVEVGEARVWEAHCYDHPDWASGPIAADGLSELADHTFYIGRLDPYPSVTSAMQHVQEARIGHFAAHGYASCPHWDERNATAGAGSGGGLALSVGPLFGTDALPGSAALADWDLTTLRMIVLQGCASGMTSPDHGNMVAAARGSGATCAVGFSACIGTEVASTTWAATFYAELAGRGSWEPAATAAQACAEGARAVELECGWPAGYDHWYIPNDVYIMPAFGD